MAGLLEPITCSTCKLEVGISDMGSHVCAKPPHLTPPPDQVEQDRFFADNDSSRRRYGRQGPWSKPGGRWAPPPRIDPSAANRPFLQSGLLTPANSDASHSTPLHLPLSPGPKSPLRFLQRNVTTPVSTPPLPPPPPPPSLSPERLASDSVLPTTSRSHTTGELRRRSRSPSQLQAHANDYQELIRPRIEPKATAYTASEMGLQGPRTADLPPEPRNQSPDVRRSRQSRSNWHRREMSVDSKRSGRISTLSLQFTDSASPPPLTPSLPSGGVSRGPRNVLAEIPPLPTGPLKTFTARADTANPDPYWLDRGEDADQNPKTSVSPPKVRREGPFASFDFGLPSQPKLPRSTTDPAGSEMRSKSPRSSHAQGGATSDEGGHAAVQQQSNSQSPSYHRGQESTVNNFARALTFGDSNHVASESTSSSDSSPSEAPSGSSFSSRPSQTSGGSGRKLSDAGQPDNHNRSLRLDFAWPPKPHQYEVDSPTDPWFQHGCLTAEPPKTTRFLGGGPGRSLPPLRPPQPDLDMLKSPVPAVKNKGKCRGCHETITGKSVSSADGRLTGRYHKTCFVCHKCRLPFQTVDFYVMNDFPYCSRHYHELNGSLCSACDQGIEGPCLETEETDGPMDFFGKCERQRFHPDCFTCRTCRIVLRGDYLEWDGQVYCERDGRRAAAAQQPFLSPRVSRTALPYSQSPPSPISPLEREVSDNPDRLTADGNWGPALSNSGARRFPERRTTRLMMI